MVVSNTVSHIHSTLCKYDVADIKIAKKNTKYIFIWLTIDHKYEV